MQPAPLAGTATNFIQSFLHLPRDAARTPRGDGNMELGVFKGNILSDATRTPRGDGNYFISVS